MSNLDEQYAYYTVTGAFDPTEITNRLGVQPSTSWSKGEVHPRTGLERNFSRWSLCSRLRRDMPLEAHILDVLTQLEDNAEGFLAITDELDGWIQLVGYFPDDYPGFTLSSEIVARLARYHLSVDFDLYNFSSGVDATAPPILD